MQHENFILMFANVKKVPNFSQEVLIWVIVAGLFTDREKNPGFYRAETAGGR